MCKLIRWQEPTGPRTSSSRQGQPDNSPPIYRWGGWSIAAQSRQGRKTTRRSPSQVSSDSIAGHWSKRLSSLAGLPGPTSLVPAMNRWAMINRPCRDAEAVPWGMISIPELDQELVSLIPLEGDSRPRILRKSQSVSSPEPGATSQPPNAIPFGRGSPSPLFHSIEMRLRP